MNSIETSKKVHNRLLFKAWWILNWQINIPKPPKQHQLICLAAALIGVLICGCQPKLQKGYGRATGLQHTGSINGTVVFHEMVEAGNRKVHRYSQFSPRWEKYQTVYWMPDAFKVPDENIIDKIEIWLTNRSNRTLVYVCRDYDATLQYWESLKENETDADKVDQLSRFYIDAASNYFNVRNILEKKSAPWYEIQEHTYTKASQLSGKLVEDIDTSDADVRYASLPFPGDDLQSGTFGDFDVEVLMSVDSYPFVYRLTGSKIGRSQIIVVGNASFLLNLPLVNATNRKLASSLIDCVSENEYPDDNVLFIESDDPGLQISEMDSRDKASQWNWITRKPMRYIVPNLLICFILLCFVYFPIFGRPRRIKQTSTSNFRDHVDALGQLIGKSKSSTIPRSWIEEYRRRTTKNRATTINQPETKTKQDNKTI